MNPRTHVLLLDVDGVLVTPPEYYGARLLREAPEATRAFFAGPFQLASTGRADLLDHVPAFLAQLGREQTPEAFVREWLDSENHPAHALWDAVRELRALGWRAWLATNQESHRTRHLLDVVGLRDLVDGEFASCTVGHRKPSPEYYAEVARRLDVTPDRIVFWDDTQANVEAARSAGWQAHAYRDVTQFRDAMGLPAL